MLDTLERDDLAPYLHQNFQLSNEEGPIFDVEMIEVVEMPGTATKRKPFSVIFFGPEEPMLEQAIYSLAHQDIGPLDLFLVPLGPFKDGMKYEAVFT
jgi:hypothetical protein